MTTITKGLTALALCLMTAQAEIKPFVALGTGSFAADGKGVYSTGSTLTVDQSGGAFTLSAGAFIDDNFMASVSYTSVSAEEMVSVNAISASVAYIFDGSDSGLQPLLGVSYNSSTYEETGFASIGFIPDTLSVKTTYITTDIGLLYELDEDNSLSLVYKHGISSSGEGTVASGGTTLTVNYENFRQGILSYNHKF